MPETTLFGLDKAAHEHDRMTGPLTAVWLLVFIIPMMLFTPDATPTGLTKSAAIKEGLSRLFGTLKSLKNHKNTMFYLIARMFYNDGILALIGFSGIYAAGLFGWDTTTLGIFGILILVFAIAGCLYWGLAR